MIINDCVLDLENSVDLEPGAATWLDRSRYKTDGAITTATWTQLPSGLWVLDFNSATPDYVEVTCPQLDFTSEDFSIIARIYLNSLAGVTMLFSRGVLNTDGFSFQISATARITLWTNQVAVHQDTYSTPDTAINTWYTVGVSRSGASANVYRNGVDVTAVGNVHIDPVTCARTAKIGIENGLITQALDGQMSFLKVFKYALTPGQHRNWHEKISYLYGAV